jgi:uncharacterized protein YfaP (DUF2135 family)
MHIFSSKKVFGMKQAWLIGTFGVLSSFCLLTACSASNKWVYIAQDSRGYKYHFNNTTIQKQGDNVIYDQMIILSVPQNGMTASTSQLTGSCKSRIATEDKQAVVVNGQSKPLTMTLKGGKMFLQENSELGKVLTAVCQFSK